MSLSTRERWISAKEYYTTDKSYKEIAGGHGKSKATIYEQIKPKVDKLKSGKVSPEDIPDNIPEIEKKTEETRGRKEDKTKEKEIEDRTEDDVRVETTNEESKDEKNSVLKVGPLRNFETRELHLYLILLAVLILLISLYSLF